MDVLKSKQEVCIYYSSYFNLKQTLITIVYCIIMLKLSYYKPIVYLALLKEYNYRYN